jgi:nitrogen regulatory protein PII
MEVTERLEQAQAEACMIFEEIKGQGSQLDQVVAIVEQHLEGPIIEKLIQKFIEYEAQVKQQVEATRAKLEGFEATLPRYE